MKLLLDEMHAKSIADALSADEHDVLAVSADRDLRGLHDAELLERSTRMERALVTENVQDFASITAQWATDGMAHAGVIFTNPSRFNRATVAYPGNLIAALDRFLEDPQVAGESWAWWL